MTARRTHFVMLILCVFLLAVGSASAQGSKDAKNAADMVVIHGRIYTLDSKQPWAQALAIRGDKIVAVGDNATIEKFRGARTKVIDAAGQLVLQGFVDSHSHFFEGSIFLNRVHLDGAKDLAEIRARLTDYANAHPGDGWIVGTGWDYAMFGQEKMANKKYLED